MAEEENKELPTTEEVAKQSLVFFRNTFLDFSLELPKLGPGIDPIDIETLKLAKTELDRIIGAETIQKAEVRRRVIRESDNLEEGEHPGAVIQIEFASGKIGYVNVYGGIGREIVSQDTRDTDLIGRTSHTLKTEKILAKPSHCGIQINDENGYPILSSWIVYQPNITAALTSLDFTNSRGVQKRIKAERLTINSKNQNKAFGRIANTFERLKKNIINLTPPPKK